MVKRASPTHQQFMEALASHASNPLHDGRAMPFEVAIESVKRRFRCQHNTAQDWLTAWVEDSESGVILVSLASEAVWRDGNWRGSLTDHGWRTTKYNLSFDNRGVPTIGRTGTRVGSHLVYVSSLPGWQEKVDREIAELDSAEREKKYSDRAKFRESHGDSLDVILGFLAKVKTGHRAENHQEMTRFTNMDASELWGSSGTLTIELWGDQIDAFAEVVRQHTDALRGQDS